MRAMKFARSCALAASVLALLAPHLAFAQAPAPVAPSSAPVAEGLSSQAAASKGATTVVAKDTFARARTPEELEKEKTDTVEASIQAGGLFAAGNARSLAITAATDFRIRREQHQFAAAAAANYGRAGKVDVPIDTTVQNLQGLIRYD